MTIQTQAALPCPDRWFIGNAGQYFFDWGGDRYCVARLHDGRYSARRSGFTNTLIGYFEYLDEAKLRVEIESGWRGRLCEAVQ